jgi:hypothetical protein
MLKKVLAKAGMVCLAIFLLILVPLSWYASYTLLITLYDAPEWLSPFQLIGGILLFPLGFVLMCAGAGLFGFAVEPPYTSSASSSTDETYYDSGSDYDSDMTGYFAYRQDQVYRH